MHWSERLRREAEAYIDGDYVNDPKLGRLEMTVVNRFGSFRIQHLRIGAVTCKRHVMKDGRPAKTASMQAKIDCGQWSAETRVNHILVSGEGRTPSAAISDLQKRVQEFHTSATQALMKIEEVL